jgi:hypothetical protein
MKLTITSSRFSPSEIAAAKAASIKRSSSKAKADWRKARGHSAV